MRLLLRRRIILGISAAGAAFLTAWATIAVSLVSGLALAGYFIVLAGVLQRILAYQDRVAESAALEERRRLAREYHDGLAQELAFLTPRLAAASKREPDLRPLSEAAERALQECRLAIAALTVGTGDDLSAAVIEASEAIARREGTQLTLDVKPGLRAVPKMQAALLRVVSEALTNSVRHGHAERVRVELNNGNGLLLRISDDGVGFDLENAPASGFGLVSMRERVHGLGGEFSVSSAPGAGTIVEARIA